MSSDAIRPLCNAPTVDVETAGRAFGLGRSAAYDAIARGQWPTPVVRIGRRIVVPTRPILDLLGLDANGAGPTTGPAHDPQRHELPITPEGKSDDPNSIEHR